ncbi:TonB-dependent receptor plug domain-containing protein [Mariniflexile sp.]|uniref:TonB-dependent receptor plug domain-containing protein n=1 Tax=Mariniflexile sp. TaxID=1979402 RepID=UPI00356898B2
MNLERRLFVLVYAITSLVSVNVLGQDKVYNEMTLEELLNIDVVVTASKQPEDLFETPLSTTIISKNEIARSGVTSIPEALRLSQGVIVREITPGNYDIHIRGYDDITKNAYLSLPYNTTTLVMIDNRIVYSYFIGGTFWETLPIDINDVERIEVVRGPASALYGPNAVTGVINIITSHSDKKGENITVNTALGSNNAKNASVNIGYNWDDRTKLTFSGNFTERYRFDNEYYDFIDKDYSKIEDLNMFVSPLKSGSSNDVWTFSEYQEELGAYYHEDLSLRRLGGNIFLSHNISENTNFDVAFGAQKSQSQKTGFLNFSTPLSQSESQSFYLNTRIKHNNLNAQFNINTGEDENIYKFNSYKFTNVEANLEYYKEFKTLSFRPGINYKFLSYNSPFTYNEAISFNDLNYQFKDEPRETSSYSAFMLSEWRPSSKLRIIGAFRVDKFAFNKNYYSNYEIASTYRINKNNLIRGAYSKANKSPFFFDSYINTSLLLKYISTEDDATGALNIPVNLNIKGQADLKYTSITNFELGWRTNFSSKLHLDLELFYSKLGDFVNANVYRQFQVVQQLNDAGEIESTISAKADGTAIFEDYDLNANQLGVGFTINYDISDKFKAKMFGTIQHTNISGRKDIDVQTTGIVIESPTSDNTVTTTVSTLMNPTQWSEKATPTFFGGFILNYNPNEKWNFSTDGYVYSNHTFANYNYYKIADLESIDDAKVEMPIKTNLILNAKVGYHFNKHLMTNFTIKNMLGKHREYGFVDSINSSFLIGLHWEL